MCEESNEPVEESLAWLVQLVNFDDNAEPLQDFPRSDENSGLISILHNLLASVDTKKQLVLPIPIQTLTL
jgi:hypothetical protein